MNEASALQPIDYADQNTAYNSRLLEKYRFQIPFLLVSVALIQVIYFLVRFNTTEIALYTYNSVALTAVANFSGMFAFRKVKSYPGTRRAAFVLPSFLLGWIITMIAIVLLRIDYSISQLLIGGVAGFFLALLINVANRRVDERPLLLLPSSKTEALISEAPGLKFKICSHPCEIECQHSAIVADLRMDLPSDWQEAIANAALRGTPVYHIKQLSESLTGKVQVEHLSENSFGMLAPDPSYAFMKDVFDRALAAVLLLSTWPILLLACCLIRVDDPGPAIFRQTRIGFKGEPFTIFKLRTMKRRPSSTRIEDDITKDSDPRITKLGRFLRASRIDEIPQLINVLKGEMSLIGPRPETVHLSKRYGCALDFYPYRHIIRPGITGWAQVQQGHVTDPKDVLRKLQYDFYYIKNFSLWLDFVIVIKTLKVILFRLGAR